jgi:hypothetical protein
MGLVLKCVDADLGRPVALKLVREGASHPAYRARLLREAQAMARLEHPNVVKVYEVGSDRDRLFIAMELVDGVTLSSWLRDKHSWRDVVDMFVQVGEGLAAVHDSGLVHRDFKPDNVLVDRSGRARVADFGIARIADASAQTLTNTGALMGTPGYMAPEQQFGADVDARADQYSYCVALREALGGRPLDDARWTMVPKQVRAAVLRGLSYEATARFPSMTALVGELRSVKQPMTEPRWIIALLVLLVIGTVAGIVAFVSAQKEETKPKLALTQDAMPAVLDKPDARDEAIVEPPPAAPVDAAPVDAAVAKPPRDASVREAVEKSAADAANDAVARAQGLNVERPTSKNLPEAQVGHPGHLPLVRAAIKDLGYDGFDPKFKEDTNATGVERAIAQVKLGQLKRRGGDCAAATALWEQALETIKNTETTWAARAWLGRSLCALGSGKADDAFEFVTHAWLHGNRDEVSLVMGFATYEKGDKNGAYAMLLTADRLPNPKVKAALKTWLDGMGFTLR